MAATNGTGRGNHLVPWPIVALVVGGVAFGAFALLSRPTGAASAASEDGTPTAPVLATGAVGAENVDVSAAANPSPVAIATDAVRSAEAAYNAGNYDAALGEYRAAIAANPNDPIAQNNVGQVLVRLERPSDAIPYFDRAVALAPETWAYHFNRARAYALMQQWTQAVAGYRQAAALFPDDYATVFNLAVALQASGNLPAALEAFQKAIALAPGQADFHLAYGRALELAGRSRDAAAAYRRYIELEPASPEAEKANARIAYLQGVQSGS